MIQAVLPASVEVRAAELAAVLQYFDVGRCFCAVGLAYTGAAARPSPAAITAADMPVSPRPSEVLLAPCTIHPMRRHRFRCQAPAPASAVITDSRTHFLLRHVGRDVLLVGQPIVAIVRRALTERRQRRFRVRRRNTLHHCFMRRLACCRREARGQAKPDSTFLLAGRCGRPGKAHKETPHCQHNGDFQSRSHKDHHGC